MDDPTTSDWMKDGSEVALLPLVSPAQPLSMLRPSCATRSVATRNRVSMESDARSSWIVDCLRR